MRHVWGTAWVPGVTSPGELRAGGSGQQQLEFPALQGRRAQPGGTHHGPEGWVKEQLSPYVCQGSPPLF